MTRLIRMVLLSSAAMLCAGSAFAQTAPQSLEERIAKMEAAIAQLKDELQAERSERARLEARSDDAVVRLETVDAQVEEINSTLARVDGLDEAAHKNGFRVGDATLKVGGFIDLDTHFTHFSEGNVASISPARDFLIPGATPVGGESTNTVDFTAQATRFFVQGQQQIGGKTLTGYIETDFLVTGQGNERVSNSAALRIRRAYIDYGNWRLGQEWSTFQNTSAIPESASFLTLSEGQVFVRQPLIRYTNGPFQFAVENPNATFTDSGGGSIEGDSNFIPDVIARYNIKGDFGNISFSAIGRQLRLEAGEVDEQTFGYGLNAAGRINLWGNADFRFNAIAGEGLGRYVAINTFDAAAINPATGALEAIPLYGGFGVIRHPFNDTTRINIGYSALVADNPDFVVGSESRFVQSAYAALLWDPLPRFTVGGEVLVGRRELENGDAGDILRFTFSTKYAF